MIFHCISGVEIDLPFSLSYFQMVASPDKKSLYAIGGHGEHRIRNEIYKFHCPGAIETCKWTKTDTTLRDKRREFVAIPIPQSLAEKLCK